MKKPWIKKNLIIENLEKRAREKNILAFHPQSHEKLPVNLSQF